MKAYKVFTHDLRSPIQGGDPVWAGRVPHELPVVEVDTSERECGAGWNACRKLDDALRIGGLWPSGWPSVAYEVRLAGEVVERGDKVRTNRMVIERRVTEEEIGEAVGRLSARWFGEHAEAMAREQMAWRDALGRPLMDERAAEAGLLEAIEARGLDWQLRRFESTGAALAAWVAWDAQVAWDAWVARVARDAQVAWATRVAWAAWDARVAWAAWDARVDWAAWDARDARAALTVSYAAKKKMTAHRDDLLTAGILEACRHGLAVAVPTGPNELGWALVD